MAMALERLAYGRIPPLPRRYQSLKWLSQKSGNIDLAKLLPAAQQVAGDTLPQVTVGGTVTMTYRQLNADGAGPITCQVSAEGTQCFNTMQVTMNVPGNNGRSSVARWKQCGCFYSTEQNCLDMAPSTAAARARSESEYVIFWNMSSSCQIHRKICRVVP